MQHCAPLVMKLLCLPIKLCGVLGAPVAALLLPAAILLYRLYLCTASHGRRNRRLVLGRAGAARRLFPYNDSVPVLALSQVHLPRQLYQAFRSAGVYGSATWQIQQLQVDVAARTKSAGGTEVT